MGWDADPLSAQRERGGLASSFEWFRDTESASLAATEDAFQSSGGPRTQPWY